MAKFGNVWYYWIFIIFLFLSCTQNKFRENDLSILIGTGEVNYTPRVGLNLAGNYRANDHASRGVHDSLYSRAFVAKDSRGEKVALLTIDIGHLKKEHQLKKIF